MAFIDIFIKPDPETQETAQAQVTKQESNPAPVVDQQAPSASISSDENAVRMIWQAVIDKNLPGPDYLELKNNISALDGMPLTDEQKLISSFNILKKTYPKFTKDDILKSIDTYIGVVDGERHAGITEVEKLRHEKIDVQENLIKSLKKEAEELKKKHEQILRQIDEYTTNVTKDRIELDNKERVFKASVDTVLNTLVTDKTKITSINI